MTDIPFSRLETQYDSNEDPEFHEYNDKGRKRDFFRLQSGYLGMGPESLRVGDLIIMPLGSSCPFIVREPQGPGESKYHYLIGEAVIPNFMSGGWTDRKKGSAKDFLLL